MAQSDAKEESMNCSIKGCPGTYEDKNIDQTYRHNGEVLVIEKIPAEVCNICGDTLLKPDTSRKIEKLLLGSADTIYTAPLLKFA